jgi:predicted Zn-dependent protease
MEGASTTFISHSLANPESIQGADIQVINELLNKYPYFTPAWYIAAAKAQGTNQATSLNDHMLLRQVNWLKYQEFLSYATSGYIDGYTDTKETDAIIIPVPKTRTIAKEGIESKGVQEYNTESTQDIEDIQSSTEEVEDIYTVFPEETPVKEETIEEKEETEYKEPEAESNPVMTDNSIIPPVFSEDYFLHEGIEVSTDIPEDVQSLNKPEPANENQEEDKAKSLMVMMSFSEWLMHFNTKKKQDDQEEQEQRALRGMWQREKLAAAMEEENDEIPEDVFEMAVNSIQKEDDLVSESLAEILVKQGKYDKAIDMYRKLSLRNPQKNAYFARKIEALIKDL